MPRGTPMTGTRPEWKGYVQYLFKTRFELTNTYDHFWYVWHNYRINTLTAKHITEGGFYDSKNVKYCIGTVIKKDGIFIPIKCLRNMPGESPVLEETDKIRHFACNEHTWRIWGQLCPRCGRGKENRYELCTDCSDTTKKKFGKELCWNKDCWDCIEIMNEISSSTPKRNPKAVLVIHGI